MFNKQHCSSISRVGSQKFTVILSDFIRICYIIDLKFMKKTLILIINLNCIIWWSTKPPFLSQKIKKLICPINGNFGIKFPNKIYSNPENNLFEQISRLISFSWLVSLLSIKLIFKNVCSHMYINSKMVKILKATISSVAETFGKTVPYVTYTACSSFRYLAGSVHLWLKFILEKMSDFTSFYIQIIYYRD